MIERNDSQRSPITAPVINGNTFKADVMAGREDDNRFKGMLFQELIGMCGHLTGVTITGMGDNQADQLAARLGGLGPLEEKA